MVASRRSPWPESTVIAARDLTAAERTAADIRATTGNPAVLVARLDLLDRSSVDQLVRDLGGPLHILVNNAGVMAIPELRRSPEGHELQFATNHLGHFRLALGLLPALRAAGGARVVSVSSRAHLNSPVIFDDIDFRDRPYDPALAYAQSKTANVLFAVAAARHWGGDGIEVNALHPGAIADSNLSRYYNPAELDALRSSGRYTFKTLAQGAATSVYVATSSRLNGVAGRPVLRELPRRHPGRPDRCRHRRRRGCRLRTRPRSRRTALGRVRADEPVTRTGGRNQKTVLPDRCRLCVAPAWASAAFSSPPMAPVGRFRCGEGNLRIGPQDLAAWPPTGSAAGVLTWARI